VTDLAVSFGDTLIAILPYIFGVVITAAAVFWVFRMLMGFFRGGRKHG